MALGSDYSGQQCSLARALEVVGERWTMLILRDAFFGVRRFSDFQIHLDISKGVLSDRLATLVDEGLMQRISSGGHPEYELTDSGKALWPSIFALSSWGRNHSKHAGVTYRVYTHTPCGTSIDEAGVCPKCRMVPGPEDLTMSLGPDSMPSKRTDAVTRALTDPHRLLEPIARTGTEGE